MPDVRLFNVNIKVIGLMQSVYVYFGITQRRSLSLCVYTATTVGD